MTRPDERLYQEDAGPIEYLLTKLSNLAFYGRLATCKTHHSNNIWGTATGLKPTTT